MKQSILTERVFYPKIFRTQHLLHQLDLEYYLIYRKSLFEGVIPQLLQISKDLYKVQPWIRTCDVHPFIHEVWDYMIKLKTLIRSVQEDDAGWSRENDVVLDNVVIMITEILDLMENLFDHRENVQERDRKFDNIQIRLGKCHRLLEQKITEVKHELKNLFNGLSDQPESQWQTFLFSKDGQQVSESFNQPGVIDGLVDVFNEESTQEITRSQTTDKQKTGTRIFSLNRKHRPLEAPKKKVVQKRFEPNKSEEELIEDTLQEALNSDFVHEDHLERKLPKKVMKETKSGKTLVQRFPGKLYSRSNDV